MLCARTGDRGRGSTAVRHWDSEKGDSGPRRSTPSQGLDHSLRSQAPADMLGEWGEKAPRKLVPPPRDHFCCPYPPPKLEKPHC